MLGTAELVVVGVLDLIARDAGVSIGAAGALGCCWNMASTTSDAIMDPSLVGLGTRRVADKVTTGTGNGEPGSPFAVRVYVLPRPGVSAVPRRRRAGG